MMLSLRNCKRQGNAVCPKHDACIMVKVGGKQKTKKNGNRGGIIRLAEIGPPKYAICLIDLGG